MKNPTVKQVKFVIEKLKLVENQATKKGAFDIDESRVYSKEHNYECGTVHCVAGWYVVANLGREFIADKIKKGFVDFNSGVELIVKDLGFAYRCDLEHWAYKNPKIWGNDRGLSMFSDKRAYNNKGFDGVIAQWELVKQNLIELEK